MKVYLVSRAGELVRRISLPDDDDVEKQLEPGETASLATKADLPSYSPSAEPVVIDELMLLAKIDREREAEQMRVLTAGGAKKYVYNRKADEVVDSRSLTTALLNALSLTDKAKRFPFANAESLRTGESLTAVLARFGKGLDASTARLATIEARAQQAKRAVQAATTMTAKQAAANVDWSK